MISIIILTVIFGIVLFILWSVDTQIGFPLLWFPHWLIADLKSFLSTFEYILLTIAVNIVFAPMTLVALAILLIWTFIFPFMLIYYLKKK